jgi:methionyl-tRNA synthetase
MEFADQANGYVNDNKPWELAKQEGQDARLHVVCSTAINIFKALTGLLKPVLPALAAQVETSWRSPRSPGPTPSRRSRRPRHQAYSHLMTRIERKQVDALLEANRDSLAPAAEAKPAKAAAKDAQAEHSEQRHAQHQAHAAATEPPRPASSSPSSRSTTSPRSTCASPRSSRPSTSKAPPSSSS